MNVSMFRRIALPMLASLGAATAVGLLFALPDWRSGPHWPRVVLLTLMDWWAWGLLVPGVMATVRKLRGASNTAMIIGAHIVAASVFSVAHAWLRAVMAVALAMSPVSTLAPIPFLATVFLGAFFWGLLVYALLVGLAQSYYYQHAVRDVRLHMARMERDYAEARLGALRVQLDPHFLFNALNTISAQISPAPKLARQMIGHLGDLLRASLDSGGRPEITLAEELGFLGHYLAIQRIRFGDSLQVGIHVDADVERALVPNLLMQPLVENAIRHGISPRARGGVITITATRNGDELDIRIQDDGIGLPVGWSIERGHGIGLSITRERVLGLPPGQGRFDVRPRPEGGTEVAIALPCRLAAAP